MQSSLHVGHAHHSAHPSRPPSTLGHRKEGGRAHNPSGHQVGGDRSNHASRPASRSGSPNLSRRSPAALGPMRMTALQPDAPSAPRTAPTGSQGASGISTPALPGAHGTTPLPQQLAGFNPLALAQIHADGISSPYPRSGAITPNQGWGLGLDDLSLGALLPPAVSEPPWSQGQTQASPPAVVGDSPASSGPSGRDSTASAPSDPSSYTSAPSAAESQNQADALLRSLGMNDVFTPSNDDSWAVGLPSLDLNPTPAPGSNTFPGPLSPAQSQQGPNDKGPSGQDSFNTFGIDLDALFSPQG